MNPTHHHSFLGPQRRDPGAAWRWASCCYLCQMKWLALVLVPRSSIIRPRIKEKCNDFRVPGFRSNVKRSLLLQPSFGFMRCGGARSFATMVCVRFRVRSPEEQFPAKFWGYARIKLGLDNCIQSRKVRASAFKALVDKVEGDEFWWEFCEPVRQHWAGTLKCTEAQIYISCCCASRGYVNSFDSSTGRATSAQLFNIQCSCLDICGLSRSRTQCPLP
jgi:hypothetical protein